MRLTELDVSLKLHFEEGSMCTTADLLHTLTFEVRDSQCMLCEGCDVTEKHIPSVHST